MRHGNHRKQHHGQTKQTQRRTIPILGLINLVGASRLCLRCEVWSRLRFNPACDKHCAGSSKLNTPRLHRGLEPCTFRRRIDRASSRRLQRTLHCSWLQCVRRVTRTGGPFVAASTHRRLRFRRFAREQFQQPRTWSFDHHDFLRTRSIQGVDYHGNFARRELPGIRMIQHGRPATCQLTFRVCFRDRSFEC